MDSKILTWKELNQAMEKMGDAAIQGNSFIAKFTDKAALIRVDPHTGVIKWESFPMVEIK